MNWVVSVDGSVAPEELVRLYDSVGWHKHAALDVATAVLANSDVIVCARAGGELVGFGRALTDRILYAGIYDMVVAPSFQRQGIGTAILKALLGELRGVRKVCLSTTTGAEAFYLKHGFEPGQGYFHLYQW
ncbi:MAG: GNAT family N-acetyltransferase [Bacillota bacterium]